MLRPDILDRVSAYIDGHYSLEELAEFADDYDWDEKSRTSPQEWDVMGTIALYSHEIAEGLRAEKELRQALVEYMSPTLSSGENLRDLHRRL